SLYTTQAIKDPTAAPKTCATTYIGTNAQSKDPATAKPTLTAGLRCAPLYGPATTTPINTPNAQAVVMTIQPSLLCPFVFSSKTLATTPEPIEMSKAVPTNSATKIFILFFGPVFSAIYSFMPKFQIFIHFLLGHVRGEGFVSGRHIFKLSPIFPKAYCQACQIGRSQCCGFSNFGAFDVTLNKVGLKLHQKIVGHSSPVYFHFFGRFPAVFFHRLKDICHLVCNGFQRCAGEVSSGSSPCDAKEGTSGILVPIGSTQSCESRYKINPLIVFSAFCQGFAFLGMPEQLQAIAQPLNGCSSNKYAAFQRIGHFIPDLPGNRGQKLISRFDRFASGIHNQKTTRTVGGFCHARFIA